MSHFFTNNTCFTNNNECPGMYRARTQDNVELSEHMRKGIAQCRETLITLLGRMAEIDFDPAYAKPLVELSGKLQKLSTGLEKTLIEIAAKDNGT